MARNKTPKWVEQQQQILKCIERHASTTQDIAEVTEMHESTAKERVRELAEAGRVHIGGWCWSPASKRASRMYLAGPGEDAPRPEARAGDLPWPPVKESELTPIHGWAPIRKAKDAPVIRRDPLIAALFGEYQGARA